MIPPPLTALHFIEFLKALSQHRTSQCSQIKTLKEGQYYTALQRGDTGRVVLKDPTTNDRAKALLVFYNATTRENLSLKTSDGKISIIEGVAPWQNASREINAVRIGFSIHDENEELISTEEKVIDRGSAYAIILRESEDGEFQTGFSRAQTDTSQ